MEQREKHQTQACHEKQGNRESFPSRLVQPGKVGMEGWGGGDVAALTVREAGAAKLSGRHMVFRAQISPFLSFFFFPAHPFRQKSKL